MGRHQLWKAQREFDHKTSDGELFTLNASIGLRLTPESDDLRIEIFPKFGSLVPLS